MKLINVIFYIVTTFFFVVYWTQVSNWYYDGVEWYGIIGAGVAANGGFFANIIHGIMEKNDEYKAEHGGEDMPFVKNLKRLFNRN
jgi:hypothetical protein